MILYVRVLAPFAAFRPLAAGWFRPTAKMVTPSAAYGLLLNFAAIDSRLPEHDEAHDGVSPTTYTQPGLPTARIALGIPASSSSQNRVTNRPTEQIMLQQLHNYPVGKDAGVPKEWTKGNKNNITPVKREFLSDLDVVIAVDATADLCERIQRGLRGDWNGSRYGLPFLGDNSFLLDQVEVSDKSPSCFWYESIEGTKGKASRVNDTTRLTIEIDRAGFSGTRSALFAPSTEPSSVPSATSWSEVGTAGQQA